METIVFLKMPICDSQASLLRTHYVLTKMCWIAQHRIVCCMMGMPMTHFTTGWACPSSPLLQDGHAHLPLCHRMGMPTVPFATGWACPPSPLPQDGHAHRPLCHRMGMPMVHFATGWACPWPSFLIHGYAHSL